MTRKTVLLFTALLITTHSIVYNALESGVRLNEGDEIVSTLGLYKLVFISNDCSFNFYQFNKASQNYIPLSQKYKGSHNG